VSGRGAILLCRIGAALNQIGKLRGSRVERNLREWLFGLGHNAMVGENGMGDHGHDPLGHVGEVLNQEEKLAGLSRISRELLAKAEDRDATRRVVPDSDRKSRSTQNPSRVLPDSLPSRYFGGAGVDRIPIRRTLGSHPLHSIVNGEMGVPFLSAFLKSKRRFVVNSSGDTDSCFCAIRHKT
jgi:hypothetical protein